MSLLLVEDDEDIRIELTELLSERGFDVVAKKNGADALHYLQSGHRPCLILLDLMMPVMNGWQMRGELLKDRTLASIPVILLSGAGDVRNEARSLGALAYISKPFDLHQLVSIVAQYC